MGYLALAGGIVMIIGVLLILLSTVIRSRSSGHDDNRKVEARGGGVVMIGPIPLVFGSDARWAVLALALAIALVILGLFLSVRVQ